MQELVQYIISGLVENKEAVKVEMDGDAIKVTVAKEDMGKIIGKQGRTAKAIRTIVRAVSAKNGNKVSVDIIEIQMNFIIGEIVKAQGIKGEVKVKPMTDDLARFGCLKTVSVDGCPFKLRNATARGGFVYLSFEGVNSRNDAEVLVGRKILIDRSQAKKTEEGEFFIVDLLGSDVYLSNNTRIGVLKYIDNFGSADVFTVVGEKTVRFPFLKKLNLSFNQAERAITVDKKAFEEICCYED